MVCVLSLYEKYYNLFIISEETNDSVVFQLSSFQKGGEF